MVNPCLVEEVVVMGGKFSTSDILRFLKYIKIVSKILQTSTILSHIKKQNIVFLNATTFISVIISQIQVPWTTDLYRAAFKKDSYSTLHFHLNFTLIIPKPDLIIYTKLLLTGS